MQIKEQNLAETWELPPYILTTEGVLFNGIDPTIAERLSFPRKIQTFKSSETED